MNLSEVQEVIAALRDRVQRLEDEAAIHTLVRRRAHCNDERWLEPFLELFQEDACYEVVGRARHEGIAQIRALTEARWAGATGVKERHVITSILVDLEGDTARGRTYFNYILVGAGAPALSSTGFYEDHLVRTAAGWKIQSLRINVDPR